MSSTIVIMLDMQCCGALLTAGVSSPQERTLLRLGAIYLKHNSVYLAASLATHYRCSTMVHFEQTLRAIYDRFAASR
jgi:hypothetical protein